MNKKYLLLLLSIFILTSCDQNKLPSCSDKETIETLNGIIDKQLNELRNDARYEFVSSHINYNLINIRTTKKSDLANYCLADISYKADDVLRKSYLESSRDFYKKRLAEIERDKPIKYKIELLDNKKEFIVTMY